MSTVSNLALVEPQQEAILMRSYDEIVTELGQRIKQDNEEFNSLCDQLESLQTTHELTKAELKRAHDEIASLKASAQQVISNAAKIQAEAVKERKQRVVAQAELRELRKLDPKRLIKVNKELKTKNATLKKEKAALDASRKEALKQHKLMLTHKQDNGVFDYWICPETKCSIRLTRLQVSKENTYEGVPATPVLEYFNPATGVTRQGTLNLDGGMSWVSDPCELPPSRINSVAKQCVIDYCERNKIKLPKEVK